MSSCHHSCWLGSHLYSTGIALFIQSSVSPHKEEMFWRSSSVCRGVLSNTDNVVWARQYTQYTNSMDCLCLGSHGNLQGGRLSLGCAGEACIHGSECFHPVPDTCEKVDGSVSSAERVPGFPPGCLRDLISPTTEAMNQRLQ